MRFKNNQEPSHQKKKNPQIQNTCVQLFQRQMPAPMQCTQLLFLLSDFCAAFPGPVRPAKGWGASEGHIYGLRNLFENLRQNWKDSTRNVHLAWGWAPEMPRPAYLTCKKPRKTATYWVGLGERHQAEAHKALRSTVGALRKEPMHTPPTLTPVPSLFPLLALSLPVHPTVVSHGNVSVVLLCKWVKRSSTSVLFSFSAWISNVVHTN